MLAILSANFLSFFVSPRWKSVFSRTATSPSAMRPTAILTTLVAWQFGAKMISFPMSSPSLLATGFSEASSRGWSLRLPKWETQRTLAPREQRKSIVGIRTSSLWSSATRLSEVSGTLRLQRSHTVLPVIILSLRSEMLFSAWSRAIFRFGIAFTSSNTSTAGSFLPASASKMASPPSDSCRTLSDSGDFFATSVVSPPTTMTVGAVLSMSFARQSAVPLVPAFDCGLSWTPIGPYQTIVLHGSSACSWSLRASEPTSRTLI
mmetsp:Transcript_39571/g.114198  ORF Transcript_39571/g.114198 Transcript_39571/m.114198 type:complete len:262 (-) Transcript_39571:1576-2361(-)